MPVRPQAAAPRPVAAPPPPPTPAAAPAASVPSVSSAPLPPVPSSAPSADQKAALLAAIRDANKMLYSMVFAQAQKVELGQDALTLTFAPQHRSLKSQLEAKRAWIEQ